MGCNSTLIKNAKLLRRQPVTGFLDERVIPGYEDYVFISQEPTETAIQLVVVAHTSAWKVVRKYRGSSKIKPMRRYCWSYHDRILFNGNGVITCHSKAKDNDSEVVIAPISAYKIVRRANVKPLKAERPVPTPHKSHRMTAWKTEIRSPGDTSRFHRVRYCKRCALEQMHHPAGGFSPDGLSRKCE